MWIRLDGSQLATQVIHTHGDWSPIARLIVVFDATPVGSGADPEPAQVGEIAAARWVCAHPDELRYPALASFPI